MTTPDDTQSEWSQLCGSLPDHASEILASHGGLPTIAQQEASHGTIAPPDASGVSVNWPAT